MGLLKLHHWMQVILSLVLVVLTWLLAQNSSGALALPATAVAVLGTVLQLLHTVIGLTSDSVQTAGAKTRALAASAATKTMAIFGLVVLFAGSQTACMAANQQPGQTPAQVQACSTDATIHNVLTIASGVLAGGATTEATVAGLAKDDTTKNDLAIAGAVTAGVAGAAVLASQIVTSAYNNDGCAPALPSHHASATIPPVAILPGWRGRDETTVMITQVEPPAALQAARTVVTAATVQP